MFNSTNRRFIQAVLVVGTGLVNANTVSADERAPRSASTELRRLLPWFPADTETLVVAQSFSLPRRSDRETASKSANVMPALAMGEFAGLDFDRHFEPFIGRKILIAVNGMRRSQPVGSMGDFYAEGCSVVVFERDLGQAAVTWTSDLRKNAKEIRKIAGREIFCLSPRESRARRHPSVYFLRLAPNTILCATHDDYLRELLNHIDNAPRARAFPDSFPQWATVDRSAPVWMIREIPGNSLRVIEGVTWTWANDQARVVYLPRGSSAGMVLGRVRRLWEARTAAVGPEETQLSESLRKAIRCELGKDGRVTVSFKTEGLEDGVRFMLFLGLFVSQIEDGNVGPL
ncbi:MAG TPA: hypothetical protein VFG04_21910 [Planctomycetaceae bacterium]|jgi:hypothetical protein|nr:hypothetical protein [Planctomycetaceae bacterium]